MSRRNKKKRDKQRRARSAASANATHPDAPRSPLTEAWRSRVMQRAVRRGERQPGRSS